MTDRTPQSGTHATSSRSMPMMILITTLAGSAVAPALAAADLDKTVDFHIPAQPLDSALLEFSKQAHVQLAVNSHSVGRMSAPSVDGPLVASAALSELLQHSGLEFVTVGNTVTVSPIQAMSKSDGATQPVVPTAPSANTRITRAAGSADEGGGTRAADSSQSASASMAEVLVSAEKRDERLQDVPVPVTAISSDALVTSGSRRLQDYYNKIPGLSLTEVDDGFTSVAIRGVTAGGIGSSPTVSTVVDDIPFGATFIVNGYQESVSDFDPSELQRVEVLRGPQGTLYGASSMGGLIKYVTVDPSTDRLGGHLRVGGNAVAHGNEGYDVVGNINVPLNDTFAVRASGSARRDPGYIDNVFSHQDNVNSFESQTARLAALWKPMEDFSIKLSAQYQRTQRGGSSEIDLPAPIGPTPGLKDYQQVDLPDTGWQRQQFQTYSAIIKKKWGEAELTSLTGYSIKQISNLQDYSPALGGLANALFGVGGFVIGGHDRLTKLSQELRLSLPITSRIDWMVGVFYTHEISRVPYLFRAVDPATLTPSSVAYGGLAGGTAYQGDDPQSYLEYAGFTDITVKLTDEFDVQLGARESHNKLGYSNYSIGPFNGLLGQTFYHEQPQLTSTENPFTYLLSPRYKFSPDLMVYARLASGYRPGGFNINPVIRASGFPTFRHDTTKSYEIGTKGDLFEKMLTFDASVYYIDWKDIQLELTDPADVTVKYTLNAGRAVSKGAELALTLRPAQGLNLSGWADFNDAKLTELPPNSTLTAKPGDRLPYSARWSAGLSADQQFPLTDKLTGFAGASLSYVGDRKGQFLTGGILQGTFPSYVQADVNGGVMFDTWKIDAFVDNVADRRGVLRNGNDSLMGLPYRVTYIRPRTYGISVSKDF